MRRTRHGACFCAAAGRRFLLGDDFTVADGYAYYVLRSLRKLDAGALERSPVLRGYFDALSSRPSVRSALEAEGIAA